MLPRYNLLRSSGLRVAARSPASVSGMAPLSDAAKAALKGFLQSMRGTRSLHAHVVEKLVDFFASKGMSLADLTTDAPASKEEWARWEDEWCDYAHDAGLTDSSDKKNVARWIGSSATVMAELSPPPPGGSSSLGNAGG